MPIGHFLGGVAALIRNPADNTYLMLKRASHRDYGAEQWECVTGRVDQGESFEEALHREVREEIQSTVTIEFLIDTAHFYRGEAIPENELLGVKYLCSIHDPAVIQIDPQEHSEFHWMTPKQIYDLIPSTHWLHQTLQMAEMMRTQLPPDLAAFLRSKFQP